jgi:hypothetical protein
MSQVPDKEQTSNKKDQPLGKYPVSCSPASLPDDWKKCKPKSFISIPEDIILVIADYLSRSDREVLEQVSKYFLTIIRSKWPPKPEYLILYDLNTTIEYLLELSLRELCMALHKVEITYNNVISNSKMGPTRYFLGRICHRPPCDSIMSPSQWEGLMVKFEKDNGSFNQYLWRRYMEKCKNLVYLTLTDADDIFLEIENLEKLEGLFVKLKSADGLGACIIPPSSMKEIVLYASEENYQEHHTQFLEGHVERLGLHAPKCTELEFW